MSNDWCLPQQLAREIAESLVNWKLAEVLECEEFHQRFTLHDSHWIGLHTDVAWDGEATAVICFDPIWNDIGEPKTSNCEKWPIMLIRFSGLCSIEIQDYTDIDGMQRGIATAHSEVVDKQKMRTIIADHYGGKVILNHDNLLEFLLFRFDGVPITIAE